MPEREALISDKKSSVAVLLCKDLAKLGSGLDLKQLCLSLEGKVSSAAVEVLPDLCEDLGQIPPVVDRLGADRIVLGLCSGDYSQVEMQSRAKKAGLDPFAVEAVALGTLCAASHARPQATLKARMLLVGAVAKLMAFQGSGPANTKLHFLPKGQKVTRRALFTVPPVGYCPVPGIVEKRCIARTGCRLCMTACPSRALSETGGSISLDKAKCGSCGICLAACPREALDLPGWSYAQIGAQLSAILKNAGEASEPVGIVFTCQKSAGMLENLGRRGLKYSHQWLPVNLPCLGMVTPGWILQVLARGAGSVAVLPCDADCIFGQKSIINGRVDFCHTILSMLGQPASRIRSLGSSQADSLSHGLTEDPLGSESGSVPALKTPMSLGSSAETLNTLRSLWDGALPLEQIVLEHRHSPFGVLELQDEGCTACLACIPACPTGALSSAGRDGGKEISFVPSACTGCGVCADICPEKSAGVLKALRSTDLAMLSQDRVVLRREERPRKADAICEACGEVIASDALMQRVAAILQQDNHPWGSRLSRYCPACRASLAWAGQPAAEA